MTAIDRSAGTRLGAHLDGAGTTFGLRAPHPSRVELVLVEDTSTRHHDLSRQSDGTWVGHVPGVGAGQRYGFRAHGDWRPEAGRRFNPAKLLLDPYARAITGGVDYNGPILDHVRGANFLPDTRDSLGSVPLSLVVPAGPPPTPLPHRRPMAETVLYELHVKGFTRLHPKVPDHLRGTYAGLAYPAVLDYLVDLGVTAVELLPVHHFVSEPFLIARGLRNFWGYNTVGYFAPHAAYCSVGTRGEQVQEFRDMVSAFHHAGLEVILDVVYNHTGEGDHEGPTLGFRGLDHAGYYRLTDDLRDDYDVTGCGNSVNTAHPEVLAFVLDSLRYWVTQMGVDGFRFDLLTTLVRDARHHVDPHHALFSAIRSDPVLGAVKLIAEPWDLGPHGYQLGRFGAAWSEWNDGFRSSARDFWRGEATGVSELARRLSGSPDVFSSDGRAPTASVNFVTAHDGFTLRDLVTYDVKHNGANGESNRDGPDENRSWNCGLEGETSDLGVVALRHRQAKNLLATVLLAAGIPMITAGDELGRTQGGNNNAYCQDSHISWVHWDTAHAWSDLTDLTRTLVRLRREHPVLRPSEYRRSPVPVDGASRPAGRRVLAWFGGGPSELTAAESHHLGRRTLGMYVGGEHPERGASTAFLVWFHGGPDGVEVELPGGSWAEEYTVLAHTGAEGELPTGPLPGGSRLWVPGRTVVVLRAG